MSPLWTTVTLAARRGLQLLWDYLNDPEAYRRAKERDRKRKENQDAEKNRNSVGK